MRLFAIFQILLDVPSSSVAMSRARLNPGDIQAALEAIRERDISVRQAAKEFNINRMTLQRRVNGTHGGKWGGQPKFAPAEETKMAEILGHYVDSGLPVSKLMMKKVVYSFGNTTKGLQRHYPLD